ncbi:MAG: L,D-transpeptidase [Patescibacteria group bacterium]
MRVLFVSVAAILLVLAISSFFLTTKKVAEANACGGGTSETFDPEVKVGFFDGQEIPIPYLAFDAGEPVLGTASSERFIEVDLSEQRLRAWEGSSLFLETLVSTGLPWWPTPTGEFRIWTKLRSTKMEGGSGRYYYNLPNVPFVMYFENAQVPSWRGYGLHGTYWHNDFGTPRSHGCVNLPTGVTKELFYWVNSKTKDSPGTRIVIHD